MYITAVLQSYGLFDVYMTHHVDTVSYAGKIAGPMIHIEEGDKKTLPMYHLQEYR